MGHDGGPVWGMPWPTGVDQTGPARCGDAGRSSRRSSACWTARSGARARSCSSKGEPGTRKSLLLARAGEEAGHRGFLLVVAAAGELSPAPLLAAVNAARATPGNGAGRRVTTAPAPRADVVLAGLEDEPRDTALLQMLASAAPAAEVMRVLSGLIASEPNYAQLTDAAQRMLATAHAVTPALRGATGLDWSIAIIGLCKAVEVEAIQRIAEPLRLAASNQDISAEAKDHDFARVARYCLGAANAPELGSLAYFLRTAANSKSRAKTSMLVSAVRTMTKAWPSADWLFAEGGFTNAVEQLTREYRNPAAHTALLDEEDFNRCSNLVHGQDGLLWRLAIATSRSSRLRPLS